MKKCLCFDCYAGFDPYMAAGALLDMCEDDSIAVRICGKDGFSFSQTARGGMECMLFGIKPMPENGFALREDIISEIDGFNVCDKTKTSLKSMVNIAADAMAVNPDDAQFEISDAVSALTASAIVLEIMYSANVEAVYATNVHISSESGLFGSFTSPETSYICNKYNINTAPLAVNEPTLEPMGAALLACMGAVKSSSAINIEKCGYGAGKSDFENAPNILRAVIGREEGEELAFDESEAMPESELTIK